MFQSVLGFINKPFPEGESKFAALKVILLISIFVFFFLSIFQPFGISSIESNKLLICLGFGFMTFLGAFVFEITVGQLLRVFGIRKHWTFGKWTLYNLGSMIFISLFNFLFIRWFQFGYVDWQLFPVMIYGTFMIGIIPLVVFGGITMNKQENKYRAIATQINNSNSIFNTINIDETKLIFDIPLSQIKYIEALQNYVKIGYFNENDGLVEKTERSTLKRIITMTEGTSLVKCHRSFMVNKSQIKSTSGNAQGLLLELSDCDKLIPVSRSCVQEFR